jgi:iron complex outermembrane receptor protein
MKFVGVARMATAVILGLCMSSMVAFAQSGAVSGTIHDPDKRTVEGAEVILTDQRNGHELRTTTDALGEFKFSPLADSTYAIDAHVNGYKAIHVDAVSIGAGAPVVHDFDLSIAMRSETVNVTTASGYRTESAAVSPVTGTLSLQNTPYSVHVITSDLMENLQATSFESLYRVDPLIQMWTTPDIGGNVIMRGFTQPNYGGKDLDGMRYYFAIPNVEEVDNLEVLTGLSGFLYGSANVGGSLNYVLKRPTPYRFADVTSGDYGNSGAYLHGDFGGPIDANGKVGFRLNVVGQDGGTPVQYQSTQRYLASGAIDWHVTDTLLLQFNGTDNYWNIDGSDGYWNYAANANQSDIVKHGAAPAAEKLWNQKYANSLLKTSDGGNRLLWTPNRIFTVRGAYNINFVDQGGGIFSNNNVATSTSFTQALTKQGTIKYRQSAIYGFLDAEFKVGSVRNKVTTGYFGDKYFQWRHADSSSATLTGFNFIEPIYVAQPAFGPAGVTPLHRTAVTNNNNMVVGDDLQFGSKWSALAGVTAANVIASNFNVANGVSTSSYNKWKATPSASLLYRPVSNVTTYFTYVEGLEQGAIVPSTGAVYTNAGQVLPPFTDRQYEFGAKTTVHQMALTASLFQINRALQYVVNNGNGTLTEVQDGREVHKGVELTAIGRLTSDLTFFGGATFFGAKVSKNQSAPQLNGQTPSNVAEQMIKGYLEYAVPRTHGLYLTGGAYWTGKRYADSFNTDRLAPFGVGDLGLRYETRWRRPLIVRATVTNLANESYWMTGFDVGAPRSVSASLEWRLFGEGRGAR